MARIVTTEIFSRTLSSPDRSQLTAFRKASHCSFFFALSSAGQAFLLRSRGVIRKRGCEEKSPVQSR